MTIPDIPPGAGRWRYDRELHSSRSSGSLRDDTSLTKRRLRSPLKDPELLDSIVKDMQISAERERRHQQYPGTGMPRYVRWLRQPAFDPMRHQIVLTGFTS